MVVGVLRRQSDGLCVCVLSKKLYGFGICECKLLEIWTLLRVLLLYIHIYILQPRMIESVVVIHTYSFLVGLTHHNIIICLI